MYIGAIVGGAVLGLLVVLLTVALIVLCTRTRARQKMVMSQDVLGHLTLSQRYTSDKDRDDPSTKDTHQLYTHISYTLETEAEYHDALWTKK